MIRYSLIVLALTTLPVAAQETSGRYIAVPDGGADKGIWVVDTQTGEAKFCVLGFDDTVYCTEANK